MFGLLKSPRATQKGRQHLKAHISAHRHGIEKATWPEGAQHAAAHRQQFEIMTDLVRDPLKPNTPKPQNPTINS